VTALGSSKTTGNCLSAREGDRPFCGRSSSHVRVAGVCERSVLLSVSGSALPSAPESAPTTAQSPPVFFTATDDSSSRNAAKIWAANPLSAGITGWMEKYYGVSVSNIWSESRSRKPSFQNPRHGVGAASRDRLRLWRWDRGIGVLSEFLCAGRWCNVSLSQQQVRDWQTENLGRLSGIWGVGVRQKDDNKPRKSCRRVE
jgi:hypothetical protein